MMARVAPYLCGCCRREVGVQYGGEQLFRCVKCERSVCNACFVADGSALCLRCISPDAKLGWWQRRHKKFIDQLANFHPSQLIGSTLSVFMDRPMGSTHPTYGYPYPINYGYVTEFRSGDGEALDAYVLGVDEPVRTFRGVVIAVIERVEEDDPKLIVVPKGRTFSDEEIRRLTHFQEQYFTIRILREPVERE